MLERVDFDVDEAMRAARRPLARGRSGTTVKFCEVAPFTPRRFHTSFTPVEGERDRRQRVGARPPLPPAGRGALRHIRSQFRGGAGRARLRRAGNRRPRIALRARSRKPLAHARGRSGLRHGLGGRAAPAALRRPPDRLRPLERHPARGAREGRLRRARADGRRRVFAPPRRKFGRPHRRDRRPRLHARPRRPDVRGGARARAGGTLCLLDRERHAGRDGRAAARRRWVD